MAAFLVGFSSIVLGMALHARWVWREAREAGEQALLQAGAERPKAG